MSRLLEELGIKLFAYCKLLWGTDMILLLKGKNYGAENYSVRERKLNKEATSVL
jgi:hypothetical protein